MINIAQSNPVVWQPPVSGATAPVTAVVPVRPVQESARNGQPSTGREQDTPSARADRRAEAREVARQGRETAGDSARNTAGRAGNGPAETSSMLTRQETEQNAKQVAADQAAEEARSEQRQELLSNVWKASAAVVDRVLGRDEATNVKPAAESQASSGSLQPMEQIEMPWPVMPQEGRSSGAGTDFPLPEEVVAYDERGNSTVAPVETGLLISERV